MQSNIGLPENLLELFYSVKSMKLYRKSLKHLFVANKLEIFQI